MLSQSVARPRALTIVSSQTRAAFRDTHINETMSEADRKFATPLETPAHGERREMVFGLEKERDKRSYRTHCRTAQAVLTMISL